MPATSVMSDPLGTTLPRCGFFPGVRAPRYRGTVINGELAGTSTSSETNISGWLEPHMYQAAQTSPAPQHASQLLMESWPQADTPMVRNTDVAYAYVSGWADETYSPRQDFRRRLAPLLAASDALLESIRETLEHERGASGRARHAGLAAVARLADMLGLTRPTILRMGGVPSSTFYAWQKNPHSVIRTPTVTRLLQLQAQVAILDEALSRERMRAWMLSPERFSRLEGDDAAFAEVLAEAQAALESEIPIKPRPRMLQADYASGPDSEAKVSVQVPPSWPGASKIPAEEDKQA
jgi:hypothetical protein